MKLHLINGFLGSGKTTAIIAAAKNYMEQGKKVGIVTNDKGRYQVDTTFFRANEIPTRQVAGGCFRCSFDEFEAMIAQLNEAEKPDIIFAESVGSCVDLVNTIFSPLIAQNRLSIESLTYSVFTDIRLFKRWIFAELLPFSDNILYLFGKQIEETELLILNKADLLTSDERAMVLSAASNRFPQKTILAQNSLTGGKISAWLGCLEKNTSNQYDPSFQVDYQKYKKGEQEMAWMDRNFDLTAQNPQQMKAGLIHLIRKIVQSIQIQKLTLGHLKFFFESKATETKLSFTTEDIFSTVSDDLWEESIPQDMDNQLKLLMNARIVMEAEAFKQMVDEAVNETKATFEINIKVGGGSYFNPILSMNKPGGT